MSDYLKQLEKELDEYTSYNKGKVTLDNCDKEPIHLIGHVQNHGVLIACNINKKIKTIDYISDNAEALFDVDVRKILGLPLSAVIDSNSIDMIEHSLHSEYHNPQASYDIALLVSDKRDRQCSFHVCNDVLFIEVQPCLDDQIKTTSFYGDEKLVVSQFAQSVMRTYSFEQLADSLVNFFFEKLKYDRVMVYKFDADEHGQVMAEAKKQDLESYLGLHYPASDIPMFARYLYVQNPCRAIVDINSTPSRILAREESRTGTELDLRFSNLRSMSPIHIEYLSNLGIIASLTMSLIKDNQLYGMVIMHNYEPVYCDLRSREIIGQLSHICSDYIQLLDRIEISSSVEKSQDIRNLISMYLLDDKNIVNYANMSEAILQLFDGAGIMIYIDSELMYANGLHFENHVAFVEAIKQQALNHSQIFTSFNLMADCPELYKLNQNICGLLLINIPSDRLSFIAICRYEQAKTVSWAGRKEQYQEDRDGRLHPRKSFKIWKEYTKNQAVSWSQLDVINAKSIRSAFIRYMLQVNEKKLAKLVSYDPLTGLPNRFFITNKIDNYLLNGDSVSLMFIDCDRFKIINDSLGHDIGDKVLIEVAKKLKTFDNDIIVSARLGGDEFTMLINSTDERFLHELGLKVVDSFKKQISFDRYTFHVPASIGIASSVDYKSRPTLMRAADMAMYIAKKQGGNSYQFIDDTAVTKADERLDIEQSLYEAVRKGEIINYYQPIISTETKLCTGMETLCRWIKQDGSIISPAKFLGVAEETGMIIPIGIKIIDQSLIDIEYLHQRYPEFNLAINLSPLQMLNDETGTYLIEETRARQVDASKITIELTEESYIEDEKELIRRIEGFKSAGFQVAIDDFGSGYSSLNYLSSLPVDEVKFDRTLISQIDNNQRAYDLLEACKTMADVCGLVSVAEGIETVEQDRLVSRIGIDRQQGFLFSKPLPIDGFQSWLEHQLLNAGQDSDSR